MARAELARRGRARATASASPPGPTCATTAPTPRSPSSSPSRTRWSTAFEAIHRRTYSFLLDRPLIVEAVSVEATGLTEQPDLTALGEVASGRRRRRGVEPETVRLWSAARGATCPCSERERMPAGDDGHRTGDHRRGQRDDRRRRRLAGGDDRRRAPARRAGGGHGRGRSSARPPTPCCSRSSTTCSCRSPSRWAPRLESTAQSVNIRSGSTSPAPSSIPTAT